MKLNPVPAGLRGPNLRKKLGALLPVLERYQRTSR